LASRLNQLQYQSLLKISRFCLHSPDNRTLPNATINKKYNYPAILKKDTVYISALQGRRPVGHMKKFILHVMNKKERLTGGIALTKRDDSSIFK